MMKEMDKLELAILTGVFATVDSWLFNSLIPREYERSKTPETPRAY